MLAVVIQRPGEPVRRLTFVAQSVDLGSHPGCGVVLAGRKIGAVHAHVNWHKPDELRLFPTHEHKTFVDGKRAAPNHLLLSSESIGIGDYTLHVRWVPAESVSGAFVPRDPTERSLLEAIAAGDRHSRGVYADWLEARGEPARAAYLRIQLDPAAAGASDHLRELAAHVGAIAWRERVAMTTVEGCAFELACPKSWDALAPTDRAGTRHCGHCQKDVVYCGSPEEARGWAARGACVALDVGAARWPDDLAPPFGEARCEACDIDVGPALPHCPRCGARLLAPPVMGIVSPFEGPDP
jgi:uncharacterized protein (TIGR02996 family)